MTHGEMGTYGTAQTRQAELEEAARRMGVAVRVNADLPDSGLFNVRAQQENVVKVLREHAPELVILPGHDQRHPDHAATPRLVFDACFYAGLAKFGGGKTHRPRKIIYVHTSFAPFAASFVVDVSSQMEKKLHAVSAYQTQFPKEGKGLASLEILHSRMRDRGRTYGMMIEKTYGEGFYQRETPEVADVMKLPGSSI
jgi:bacillithiol biosynthesis deacetylase BshB1